MATMKRPIKKAKDGDLLDRVSKTKLKDVPAKAKTFIEGRVKKGKKLASDTVEKVKNTTVGDAAKAIANTTGPGIAYNLAKKFANSDIGKQIKEDLSPESTKKALKNLKNFGKDLLNPKALLGYKHGGAVKKKMRNGGSIINRQETLPQKNARMRKEMQDREKRIETNQKEKERNSYSNTRANKVVGKKMRNGGSLSGLTASTKRDKGTDPKGAYTKVQKRTLAGARGKASLTKDKQLGATKMAKRGMSIKKK